MLRTRAFRPAKRKSRSPRFHTCDLFCLCVCVCSASRKVHGSEAGEKGQYQTCQIIHRDFRGGNVLVHFGVQLHCVNWCTTQCRPRCRWSLHFLPTPSSSRGWRGPETGGYIKESLKRKNSPHPLHKCTLKKQAHRAEAGRWEGGLGIRLLVNASTS